MNLNALCAGEGLLPIARGDGRIRTYGSPVVLIYLGSSRIIMDEAAFFQELSIYDKRLREHEEQIAQLQDELQLLQHEVIYDQDTRIHSPSYFHVRLQEEIIRSERYRHFLSLILVPRRLAAEPFDATGRPRNPPDRGRTDGGLDPADRYRGPLPQAPDDHHAAGNRPARLPYPAAALPGDVPQQRAPPELFGALLPQ